MRDLGAEYHHKELCRRFIADLQGIVDIQPLCLRTGCSNVNFYNRSSGEGIAQSTGKDYWRPDRGSLEDNLSGSKNLSEGFSPVYPKGRRQERKRREMRRKEERRRKTTRRAKAK